MDEEAWFPEKDAAAGIMAERAKLTVKGEESLHVAIH
jgi:hypothetical protein